MKRIHYIYMACALALTSLTGCGDFLEEYSQNSRYAQTANDLDELLRGECFMKASNSYSIYSQTTLSVSATTGFGQLNYPWLHVMDDDSQEYLIGQIDSQDSYPSSVLGNFHHWSVDPFITMQNNDIYDSDWQEWYKHIGALNSIIYNAGEFRGKNDDDMLLNRVEGEARFLRAGFYFLLANTYGLPYSKATAATDYCVPLKVSPGIEDKFFSRNTVAEVFDQIVEDLTISAKCLKEGEKQNNVLRVSTEAANALLSRVYLYMERYDEAVAAATEAEAGKHSLRNLNKWNNGDDFCSMTSPETIFTQGGNSVVLTFLPMTSGYDWNTWQQVDQALSFSASDDLMESFAADDLRLGAFFSGARPNKCPSLTDYSTPEKFLGMDFLIRLPEVILNKAEALAMMGQDEAAKTELKKLLACRYANMPALNETGNDLIDFVRAERRRELCFEGHRWFDLRRYSVNSVRALPADFTIRHNQSEYVAGANVWNVMGYHELTTTAADKDVWALPVPKYAVEFNKGSLTNETRPQRPLKK